MGVVVPLATFQEYTPDKTSSFWLLCNIFVRSVVFYNELKAQLIDSDVLSSSIVLKSTSQKRLREEESTNPID